MRENRMFPNDTNIETIKPNFLELLNTLKNVPNQLLFQRFQQFSKYIRVY